MAADWLTREVAQGHQALIVLRLEGCPAADTVGAVLDVWLVALRARQAWDEERDAPRIRQAFALLAGRVSRWPAPAALLESLPALPPVVALPKPGPDKQRAAKEIERLRAAIASFQVRRMPRPEPQDYLPAGEGEVTTRRPPTPSREQQLAALERMMREREAGNGPAGG
jgi:hypothetical protein